MKIMVETPEYFHHNVLRADITAYHPDEKCVVCKLPTGCKLGRRLIPRIYRESNECTQLVKSYHSRSPADAGGLVGRVEFHQLPIDPQKSPVIPFYMPRIISYAFSLKQIALPADSSDHIYELSVAVVPASEGFDQQRASGVFEKILDRIVRFMRNDSNAPGGRYEKRRLHDRLVSKPHFQDRYAEMKSKYGQYWIDRWHDAELQSEPGSVKLGASKGRHMTTDPKKHVFEDILIATFLICLWESEYSASAEDSRKRMHFIDIGCGNGLLVHLLSAEGYCGYGVDLTKRPLWNAFRTAHYGDPADNNCASVESITTRLIEQCLDPTDLIFDPDTGASLSAKRFDYQASSSHSQPARDRNCEESVRDLWLIGNHADELTGWIPLIAARSGQRFPHKNNTQQSRCKFMVLPCCFHDLSGQRNPFGRTIPYHSTASGKLPPKYDAYLEWVRWLISDICGFEAEDEWLRIPSTKNACIVGRRLLRNFAQEEKSSVFVEQLAESIVFIPRLSDREKNALRDLRKRGKAVGEDAIAADDVNSALSPEELMVFAGLDL